jgi:hypothetical protein
MNNTNDIPSFTLSADDDNAASALGIIATFYESAGVDKSIVKQMRNKAAEMEKWNLADIAASNAAKIGRKPVTKE